MYLKVMEIFLYFLVASFLGYTMEVIKCSIDTKKLVNRGFLFGPICPIYGVGFVLITWLLTKYENDLIVLFLMGALITSAVEYYTSYILEVIFHNRWWDYSYRKDNINGRICLKNSILFGVGTCFIIKVINPLIYQLRAFLSDKLIIVLGSILLVIFILDMIFSCIIAYNLRHRIIIAEELKSAKLRMIPTLLERKYKEEITHLKFVKNRLFNAFPDIWKDSKKEQELITKIKAKDKETKKKYKKNGKIKKKMSKKSKK